MSEKYKIEEYIEVFDKKDIEHEILLFNDDVNTFDYVIEMLVQVCEHSYQQAEQCSIIVHNSGKCVVKTGSYKDLKPRCSKLIDSGLSAEIN